MAAILRDRPTDVVFLVGAGVSSGVPAPRSIIQELVLEAAAQPGLSGVLAAAADLSGIGFEITLNDLRSVCAVATDRVFSGLATLTRNTPPSTAHVALREYLLRGGSVLTTNYDRLIEQDSPIPVRFDPVARDGSGFGGWRDDLERGGVLFKIHGSFERPETCMGVLEDVGTALADERAELLSAVVRDRVLCVIGWSGVDPDVPTTFLAAMRDRPKDLPVFWVHRNPDSIERIGVRMRPVASRWPINGAADSVLMSLFPNLRKRNRPSDTASPDFGLSTTCSISARARFAGQVMRRAGHEHLASVAFQSAAKTAANDAEWASAQEERALTIWGSARGRPSRELRARAVLVDVVRRLKLSDTDPADMRGPLFGLLSMTISLGRHYRRLLLVAPGQARRMARVLYAAELAGADRVDIETQRILALTYIGRLRRSLAGPISLHSHRVAEWVLAPHREAAALALTLPNRSLHSRFDAIASHALAAARLGHCDEAAANRALLNELSLLLSDPRRYEYWINQATELDDRCGQHSGFDAR
jgi:SIR2-like protein